MIRNKKSLVISWYWKLKNNDCPINLFSASKFVTTKRVRYLSTRIAKETYWLICGILLSPYLCSTETPLLFLLKRAKNTGHHFLFSCFVLNIMQTGYLIFFSAFHHQAIVCRRAGTFVHNHALAIYTFFSSHNDFCPASEGENYVQVIFHWTTFLGFFHILKRKPLGPGGALPIYAIQVCAVLVWKRV